MFRYSRLLALALSAVGMAACAERATPTAPPRADDEEVLSVPLGPLAAVANGDPTAIPIGSPARVELIATAPSARHTATFPQPPAPLDFERVTTETRDWLAREKSRPHAWHDPAFRRGLETVGRLLDARTPDEIRAALGPARARVVVHRTARPTSPRRLLHVAAARLDGRDVIRVLTETHAPGLQPQLECTSTEFVDDDGSTCGWDYYSDPSFDPEPVVADLTAMQAHVDAMAADFSTAEFAYFGISEECAALRAAFYGLALGFGWSAAETIFYAWRRNVVKTYSGLKISAGAYAAAYAAYLKYRQECLSSRVRMPV